MHAKRDTRKSRSEDKKKVYYTAAEKKELRHQAKWLKAQKSAPKKVSYKDALQKHDEAEALIHKLQADELAMKKKAAKDLEKLHGRTHLKEVSYDDEIGDEDLLNLAWLGKDGKIHSNKHHSGTPNLSAQAPLLQNLSQEDMVLGNTEYALISVWFVFTAIVFGLLYKITKEIACDDEQQE